MAFDQYKGVGVAIVTPFLSTKEIDFDALAKLVNHLINGGVHYIVALGTTGESVTLSMEEQKQVVQHIVKVVKNRVPVMVGCGGNNTKVIQQKMNEMETWADFDVFLSVSPYYSKPSQEGIYQHYKALAESTSKSILLYNVPGRTSKGLEVNTVLRLANDFDNIIGIKDAANDIHHNLKLVLNKPNDFLIISGDDDLFYNQLSIGLDGVISVIANAYPSEFVSVFNEKNQAKFQSLEPIISLIFEENNPAGIKCVLSEQNICSNELRLPLVPVSNGLEQKIRTFVSSYLA